MPLELFRGTLGLKGSDTLPLLLLEQLLLFAVMLSPTAHELPACSHAERGC
jgi:hypothetical protein